MTVTHASVVSSLLNRFQRNGYSLVSVYDGENRTKLDAFNNLRARKAATEVIIAVDTSQVIIGKDGHKITLLIVLDNNPEEILADYTYPQVLEDELDTITEAFYAQWEDKEWSKN